MQLQHSKDNIIEIQQRESAELQPEQPLTTLLLHVIIKIPKKYISNWLVAPHTMSNKRRLSLSTCETERTSFFHTSALLA